MTRCHGAFVQISKAVSNYRIFTMRKCYAVIAFDTGTVYFSFWWVCEKFSYKILSAQMPNIIIQRLIMNISTPHLSSSSSRSKLSMQQFTHWPKHQKKDTTIQKRRKKADLCKIVMFIYAFLIYISFNEQPISNILYKTSPMDSPPPSLSSAATQCHTERINLCCKNSPKYEVTWPLNVCKYFIRRSNC